MSGKNLPWLIEDEFDLEIQQSYSVKVGSSSLMDIKSEFTYLIKVKLLFEGHLGRGRFGPQMVFL